MKYIVYIVTLLVSLSSLTAAAQNDRFQSCEEMVGHKVWLYNLDKLRAHAGKFVYPTSKATEEVYENLSTYPVKVTEIVKEKSAQYLVVNLAGDTWRLLISKDFDYSRNARSVSVWEPIQSTAKSYGFISTDSYIVTTTTDLCPSESSLKIRWYKNLQRPVSLDDDVMLSFISDDFGRRTYSFKAKDFTFFKKDFTKARKAEGGKVAKSPVKETVLGQSEAAAINANRVFEAKHSNDYYSRNLLSSKGVEHFDEGAFPFIAYNYAGGKINGFMLGIDTSADPYDVRFFSDEDRSYLLECGNTGMENRKKSAKKLDAVRTKAYQAEYRHYQDSLEKARDYAINFYRSRNIIFLEHDYQYEYDHPYFYVYNCYDKAIRRIRITLNMYVYEHRVEHNLGECELLLDEYVEPYTIEEQQLNTLNLRAYSDGSWWYVDTIKPTAITIVFADGSVKTISGVKNVSNAHLENYREGTYPEPYTE